MKSLKDIKDLAGKRVILRVDFNVPIKDGKVIDPFRIEKVKDSIEFLKKAGAKIILVSHIENKEGATLKPVAEYLQSLFKVVFIETKDFSEISKIINEAESAQVFLLENIRKHEGEEKNDDSFAKQLSSLGDVYVNEAFSVSHRKHASIVGLPKYLPSFAGFLFEKEVQELSRMFNPTHPFIFILGGAKFETKEPLIKKFLGLADYVFVGGALGNDFFKAKGYEVGGSITSGTIPPPEIVNDPKILIPIDVVVRASDDRKVVRQPTEILANEIISDAGPETLEMLREKICEAHTILWNGPLGFYEKGFDAGTKAIAKILSDCRGRSIVGGGDTTAAIVDLGIYDRLSFVSTGGGAMLDFLSSGTLPGIEALK